MIKSHNGVLPGFSEDDNKQWKEPFYFVQAADTQFGMIASYIHKSSEPNWDEEMVLTKKAIDQVNAMRPAPKFMIICGDLVDAFPVGDESKRLRGEQLKDFNRICAQTQVPLVCVCGNHDVGNQPTPDTIADFRRNFGDDRFAFYVNGVQFLVANSQLMFDGSAAREETDHQDNWLLDRLTDTGFVHKIIFQHVPYFIDTPDEEDTYFNIGKQTRQLWLQRFKDHNVSACFAGHCHRNSGGWFGQFEQVITSAIGAQLGSDLSGLRVVKVYENRLEHQYYPLQEIPLQVQL